MGRMRLLRKHRRGNQVIVKEVGIYAVEIETRDPSMNFVEEHKLTIDSPLPFYIPIYSHVRLSLIRSWTTPADL